MVIFSFVIVAYNSQTLIDDCISSIYTQNDLDHSVIEIIVVDNSNDENHVLLQKVIHTRFPNVILIHNSHNGGYGQGNNLGIAHSKGEYIAIMNPDVRLMEPILKHTLQKFTADVNLALLSYKQQGGANMSFFIKPEHKPKFGVAILTKLINKLQLFSPSKHYISGAFFFIRKKDIKSIQLFDENIFLYFEEPDINNRILANKKKINLDFSKSYIHLSGGRDFNEFGFIIEITSLLYYIDKFQMNRDRIMSNYMTEYRFNLFLFNLVGKKERAKKTKNEIEVIKKLFKSYIEQQ